MSKLKFSGPLRYRVSSFFTLMSMGFKTMRDHKKGRRIAPDWDVNLETGIHFWRHQFTKAMAMDDMAKGRVYFDSVQTETDDVYEVSETFVADGNGTWVEPKDKKTEATILYLHGGGYTFGGAMARRFSHLLAHRIGAQVFAAKYRLTPEHAHPAQRDDALAAWDYVVRTTDPSKIVVMGDSAGGHMVLMLLQTLKELGKEQPALAIGMCPWTDIGERGESLEANNQFDMVQGWMALKFGEWLDPNQEFGREELSPISYNYAGLAPLYLQAGGREILRDMIVDFANVQAKHGATIMFDLWPNMPHDFQLYDSSKADAREAVSRLGQAVRYAVGEATEFETILETVVSNVGAS